MGGGFLRRLTIFLMTSVVALLVASPAWASTITVNSLDDTTANDGQCTLREAITSANNNTASGAAAGECAAGSGSDVIDIGVTGAMATVERQRSRSRSSLAPIRKKRSTALAMPT